MSGNEIGPSNRGLDRAEPPALPWLAPFEKNDYSQLWACKRIEDEAQKRIIREWLRPADACLELGGGFGRITRLLEPYFRTVLMLDLTERNLRMAKANLSKARIVRSDVSKIPARDQTFDTVVMVRVMHLLPDPKKVILEVMRVMKDGGTLIVSIPNPLVNYIIRRFETRAFSSLRHIIPTFGPAVWPIGMTPYLWPHRLFVPEQFEMTGRRGTGFFDNYLGRMMNGFTELASLDVATSALWFFKLDVFYRFRLAK